MDITKINDENLTYEQSLDVGDAILDWVEKGDFVSVKNSEERKKEMQTTATANIEERKKRKKITINVFQWDLEKIKYQAERDGLPYQTLITSIIHKYFNGTLSD